MKFDDEYLDFFESLLPMVEPDAEVRDEFRKFLEDIGRSELKVFVCTLAEMFEPEESTDQQEARGQVAQDCSVHDRAQSDHQADTTMVHERFQD